MLERVEQKRIAGADIRWRGRLRSAVAAVVVLLLLGLAPALQPFAAVHEQETVETSSEPTPETASPSAAGVGLSVPRSERMTADEATRLFREANDRYANGAYREAAGIYETILSSDFRNADVYYNLGNARYKMGDLGNAVLAYERALRLEPTHEDASDNLEFVREQLADRLAPVGGELSRAVDRFFQGAASGRLALVASILYFVAMSFVIFGVLRRLFPPWLIRTVVVLAVVLVAVAGTLGYRVQRTSSLREAVVMPDEVSVRTGPGSDFVLEFRLHEGTKVRVREVRDEWVRVHVEGTDLEGWLPLETVEVI